jgi:hypothetical protein
MTSLFIIAAVVFYVMGNPAAAGFLVQIAIPVAIVESTRMVLKTLASIHGQQLIQHLWDSRGDDK